MTFFTPASQSGNKSTYWTRSWICLGTPHASNRTGTTNVSSSGIRCAQWSAHLSSLWNGPRLEPERTEKHATNASEISIARRIARGQFCPGISLSLSIQGEHPAAAILSRSRLASTRSSST